MTSKPPIPSRISRAFEAARARTALVGALPAFLYMLAAGALGADRSTMLLGAGMFTFAAFGVFIGHPYARGVGLGLVLGAIPFTVASYAQSAGHMCLDGACVAVCMPACTAAGIATGLLGSWLLVRARGGVASFVSLATIVSLAGAMGCHCIGYGSIGGLIAGLLVASAPSWPRLIAASRA